MKRNFKILLAICLAFMVTFTTVNFIPMQANAASISAKDKSKMKDLSENFKNFVSHIALSSSKKSFTKNYNFSKQSDRKTMLSYSPSCYKSAKILGGKKDVLKANISKNLFGKTTATPKLKMTGDWGENYPELKFKSYKKVSKNTYKVTAKMYYIVQYPSRKEKLMGDVTFNLKKNSKSKYGYVVQSLKIHKTNKV